MIDNCPLPRLSVVSADNYYSSVSLANMLLNNYKLYYVGTIRKNRIPVGVVPGLDNLRYGVDTALQVVHLPFIRYTEMDWDYSVFRVKDIVEFQMITTHPLLQVDSTIMHVAKFNLSQLATFGLNRQSRILFRQQPLIAKHFNNTMGSVDIVDRLLANYQFRRKTSSWQFAAHYYFLNLIVVNAYLLYKMYRQEYQLPILSHGDFREILCNELICKPNEEQADSNNNVLDANLSVTERLEQPMLSIMTDWTNLLLKPEDVIPNNRVNGIRMPRFLKEE
eukprot:NODE_454_length_7238_cov_0.603306.p4 type:complete len:278 gc:universal NODE_454_length_7238_cov_0.603306:7013-6180(-)